MIDRDGSVGGCNAQSCMSVSPGGTKLWKPVCCTEVVPYIGQVFESIEAGLLFYKKYGRVAGFDIRSSSLKYDKDKNVVTKYYVCNRQGFSEVSFSDALKGSPSKERLRRTMVGRCGCNARMIINRKSPTCYVVVKFIEDHNHELVLKGKQFLKMSRQVSVGHQMLIVDASRCNIGLTKTHNLAKQMPGGYEHVGATNLDFKNFNRDVRCWIGIRDAQMLVEKLEDKKKMCADFFYKFDMDEDGCLNRLFWADPISVRNYKLFGDVVSFDSTYRTNK